MVFCYFFLGSPQPGKIHPFSFGMSCRVDLGDVPLRFYPHTFWGFGRSYGPCVVLILDLVGLSSSF